MPHRETLVLLEAGSRFEFSALVQLSQVAAQVALRQAIAPLNTPLFTAFLERFCLLYWH
ncbi:MAG: hypothetical protein ACFBSF_15530 [Leptolyngbyaceae cyanobacterium]